MISRANILHNYGSTTTTAMMSIATISDNFEELYKILSSTFNDSGAYFSFSAVPSDNNFDSKILELACSDNLPMPYTRKLLSDYNYTDSHQVLKQK